jgi:antitoxin MazE
LSNKNNDIRVGWDEAFKKLHNNGGDKLLIPDVFEDEFIE